jgi:F-type H+-transporting ATPase subunit delta
MAELATIARPYAEALFQATADDAAQTSEWLDALATIATDAGLRQFADSPKVSDDQVMDVITGVLSLALPEQGKNFLRLVVENGRLAVLPEVAAQYTQLKNQGDGVFDAVVQSAFAIDDAALGDLTEWLQKRFGRRLNLTVQLAPELIGGIRVAVGDEVLDTSVKARLEQMKTALTA